MPINAYIFMHNFSGYASVKITKLAVPMHVTGVWKKYVC
jgi:hypothetical protein